MKKSLGVDKRNWSPSPLAGQITLVTTLNEDGASNIAPKSWISMMAFEPPLLALGCNIQHWTARNVLKSGEFVVNIPGAELLPLVWRIHLLPHPRPVEAAGLTPLAGEVVKPPRVLECMAHLECRLERDLIYGNEVILLGQIVAASVDEDVAGATDPYAALRLSFFLEGKTYGVIEQARRIDTE